MPFPNGNYFSRSAKAASVYEISKTGRDYDFKAFRTICQKTYKDLEADRKATSERIKDIQGTYIRSKALPMIDECRAKHDELARQKRNGLTDELEKLFAAKRAALNEYFTETPSADLLTTLQTFSLRTKVSEAELEMLLQKCGISYLALAVVHDLCERNGYDFSMPITPERALSEISAAEEQIKAFIGNVDSDNLNISEMEFYGNYTEGFAANMMDTLDSDPCYRLPAEPEISALDKLINKRKELSNKAENVSDVNDFKNAFHTDKEISAIDDFIIENLDVLETPEERRERVSAEAEDLLAEVSNRC